MLCGSWLDAVAMVNVTGSDVCVRRHGREHRQCQAVARLQSGTSEGQHHL